jgi:hypothetical protein
MVEGRITKMARLTPQEERFYDDLDKKVETGEYHPRGRVTHNSDAGARFLMEATGAENVEDAQRIALGRPRLDA